MFELLPGAKIIILLRNPVDRAYSNWNMRYNDKRLIRQGLLFNRKHSKTLKSLDFSAIVNYYLDNINIIPEAHLFEPPLDIVHRGLYIQQIESLLKFYSMNKVRILITERYFENEKSNFTNLCHFLELKPHFPKSFTTCKVGQYSKNLPSETKLKLREFYQPFNKKLFQLLNEPIVEWD